MSGSFHCPTCEGTRRIPCSRCGGRGKTGGFLGIGAAYCLDCDESHTERCTDCGGSGVDAQAYRDPRGLLKWALRKRKFEGEKTATDVMIYGLRATDAVRVLSDLADDEALGDGRELCIAAIGRLGGPAAVDYLVNALQHAGIIIRTASARALAVCGDNRAVHPLAT